MQLCTLIMKRIFIFFGGIVLLVFICILASSFQRKNNLSTTQQIELGHLLFFDTRLSINNTTSCATCHIPKFAFADTFITPKGAFGDVVKRNTPTLINLSDNKLFNWAHPNITSLQQQSSIPLFGKSPVEMGMDSGSLKQLEFILSDKQYTSILKNSTQNINWKFVQNAIAAYVKTFKFYNSKYDKYLSKKIQLSQAEKRGMDVFFNDGNKCIRCHGGKDFDAPKNPDMYIYQNIGLYNVGEKNNYGNNDNGAFDVNNDTTDIGRFKIPSLRNIAITAPYFHDGTAKSLDEVIQHYNNGGRVINVGINKGDGREHPNKHPMIGAIELSSNEATFLIAFLKTLTDTSYLKNKLYQNPFKN
jgi:cytochrome c peroxidase